VILGHTVTGNILAGLVPGRVYVGHWVATADYRARDAEARWFFSAPFDEQRRQFLHEHRVDYVVFGPYEATLSIEAGVTTDRTIVAAADRPAEDSGVQRVYEADGVTLLKVLR
jgi:hypothetical protein